MWRWKAKSSPNKRSPPLKSSWRQMLNRWWIQTATKLIWKRITKKFIFYRNAQIMAFPVMPLKPIMASFWLLDHDYTGPFRWNWCLVWTCRTQLSRDFTSLTLSMLIGSSSFVSFTQCSPTCGRMPLPALSLWPGHQPCRPRLVGGRRGGGPSSVALRSRSPPTGRRWDSPISSSLFSHGFYS